MTGKPCLVVGGGAVALRKARGLAQCGARVTVVAPRLAPAFSRLGGVAVLRRAFRPGDLAGRRLAVAATDDEKLNERISALCRRKGVWCNVVDRPALCDFIYPAVVRRGPLTLALSTGGASPALARFLRAPLRGWLTPELADRARLLGRFRPRLLRIPMAARKRILSDAFLARLLKSPSPIRLLEAALRG